MKILRHENFQIYGRHNSLYMTPPMKKAQPKCVNIKRAEAMMCFPPQVVQEMSCGKVDVVSS